MSRPTNCEIVDWAAAEAVEIYGVSDRERADALSHITEVRLIEATRAILSTAGLELREATHKGNTPRAELARDFIKSFDWDPRLVGLALDRELELLTEQGNLVKAARVEIELFGAVKSGKNREYRDFLKMAGNYLPEISTDQLGKFLLPLATSCRIGRWFELVPGRTVTYTGGLENPDQMRQFSSVVGNITAKRIALLIARIGNPID